MFKKINKLIIISCTNLLTFNSNLYAGRVMGHFKNSNSAASTNLGHLQNEIKSNPNAFSDIQVNPKFGNADTSFYRYYQLATSTDLTVAEQTEFAALQSKYNNMFDGLSDLRDDQALAFDAFYALYLETYDNLFTTAFNKLTNGNPLDPKLILAFKKAALKTAFNKAPGTKNLNYTAQQFDDLIAACVASCP